jgi:hypothetical protein
MRIVLPPHAFEPAADRLHSELGGVVRDPDADETGIGGHIVHTVRHDFAELLVRKVMHVDAPWLALGAISSSVLEIANQLLFLRVKRDDRLLQGNRAKEFVTNG